MYRTNTDHVIAPVIAKGVVEDTCYKFVHAKQVVELHVRDEQSGRVVPVDFQRDTSLGTARVGALLLEQVVTVASEVSRAGTDQHSAKYVCYTSVEAHTGDLKGTRLHYTTEWRE